MWASGPASNVYGVLPSSPAPGLAQGEGEGCWVTADAEKEGAQSP